MYLHDIDPRCGSISSDLFLSSLRRSSNNVKDEIETYTVRTKRLRNASLLKEWHNYTISCCQETEGRMLTIALEWSGYRLRSSQSKPAARDNQKGPRLHPVILPWTMVYKGLSPSSGIQRLRSITRCLSCHQSVSCAVDWVTTEKHRLSAIVRSITSRHSKCDIYPLMEKEEE